MGNHHSALHKELKKAFEDHVNNPEYLALMSGVCLV
jgi:hypothetical protein